jgi:hypothetical protein
MADDRIKPMVVNALVKDGWTITHDPYGLQLEKDNYEVDLAAERNVVGAVKAGELVAVEIKSFLSKSILHEFGNAYGQFDMYRLLMADKEPDRRLYIGLGLDMYKTILTRASLRKMIEARRIPFLVVDLHDEVIVEWTS